VAFQSDDASVPQGRSQRVVAGSGNTSECLAIEPGVQSISRSEHQFPLDIFRRAVDREGEILDILAGQSRRSKTSSQAPEAEGLYSRHTHDGNAAPLWSCTMKVRAIAPR
jgi:hypothetical protein